MKYYTISTYTFQRVCEVIQETFDISPEFVIIDGLHYTGWLEGDVEHYIIFFPFTNELVYYTLTNNEFVLYDLVVINELEG